MADITITDSAKELLKRKRARTNFYDFVTYMIPEYQKSTFSEEICKEIENAVTRQNNDKILFEAPPRIGKTLLISQLLPCYYLGRFKDKKVISCSYGEELLRKNARAVKRFLSTHQYKNIFGDPFENDGHTKIEATINHFDVFQGRYESYTVGGAIIGAGANLILVDDPIKNSEMARSHKMKDSLEEWFYNDVTSRLEIPYILIVMHQRFSKDDLAGRIIDSESSSLWIRKTFKAIQENGESICEERLPISELLIKKKTMTNFEAMYQQEPVQKGGNIIRSEYFRRFRYLPEKISKTYFVVDSAMKKGEGNDYSAIAVFQLSLERDYYIIDLIRKKMESPELLSTIRDLYAKYRPSSVYIEDKSSGTGIIQFLRKERIPVMELKAVKDKYLRVSDILPKLVNGFCYIPENAPWVFDFLQECEEFTDNNSHQHDDQVDVLAYGLSDQCGISRNLNINPNLVKNLRF